MLETLVENQIIFYAMGAGAAIGVLSKLIACKFFPTGLTPSYLKK